MICPKCGTVNDDANGFCVNCALPLNAQPPAGGPQPQQAPYQVYGAPLAAPPKKSRKKLIIIGVIVIVFIIIIAAAAASMSSSSNKSSSPIMPGVSMSLTHSPIYLNYQMVVFVSMTNNRTTDLQIYGFTVTGTISDGSTISGYVNSPTALTAGTSRTMEVCFDVVQAVQITSISFSDSTGHYMLNLS